MGGSADRGVIRSPTLARVIWQRKLLVCSVAVLTVAGLAAASVWHPPVYPAEASLLVKLGREFIYRPEVGAAKPSNMFRLEEMINSEIEILGSRTLAAQVVDSVGVAKLYPKIVATVDLHERAAKIATATFRRQVKVRGIADSSVIKIKYEHRDPSVAAAAINALLEHFETKHLEVFGDPRAAFLERDVAGLLKVLEKAEAAVAALRRDHGIWDFDQQIQQLLARRTQLDTALQSAAAGLSPLDDDKAVVEAGAELLRLRLRERNLLGKYRPKSRQVIGTQSEIAVVEKLLVGWRSDDERRAEAQRQTLARQVGEVGDEVRRLAKHGVKLRKIEREAARAEAKYRVTVSRLDDALIGEQLDREKHISVRVIDRATASTTPSGMSLFRRLLLGGLAGLALGIGLALAQHSLSQP
ncbi:MAG: Wzz/FepE/Etk N-terminal domain-containing protein [Polyangiaceae bacterium]